MSRDHKPEDEDEFARIEAAGGAVTDGRVQGNLNLSRALGDFNYKQVSRLCKSWKMRRTWRNPPQKLLINNWCSSCPGKQNKELPPEQQMITALPEIKEERLEPQDEFFVVACDGIWNVMSSQQVWC